MKLVILLTLILSSLSLAFAHDNKLIEAVKSGSLKDVKNMLDNGYDANYVWTGKADQKNKAFIFAKLRNVLGLFPSRLDINP